MKIRILIGSLLIFLLFIPLTYAQDNATNMTQPVNLTLDNIYNQSLQLITSPFTHQQMLWIVLPLVIATLLMIFYFGLYKYEELGWNTAVGNGLVLVFVGLDLLRQLYSDKTIINLFSGLLYGSQNITSLPSKTLLALVILLYGLFLIFINFIHLLPKKLAFLISSALPINLIAYLSIVIIYRNFQINLLTLISVLIIFIVLFIVSKILQFFIPTITPPIRKEKLLMRPRRINIKEDSEEDYENQNKPPTPYE